MIFSLKNCTYFFRRQLLKFKAGGICKNFNFYSEENYSDNPGDKTFIKVIGVTGIVTTQSKRTIQAIQSRNYYGKSIQPTITLESKLARVF